MYIANFILAQVGISEVVIALDDYFKILIFFVLVCLKKKLQKELQKKKKKTHHNLWGIVMTLLHHQVNIGLLCLVLVSVVVPLVCSIPRGPRQGPGWPHPGPGRGSLQPTLCMRRLLWVSLVDTLEISKKIITYWNEQWINAVLMLLFLQFNMFNRLFQSKTLVST